jgi:hypothetical protein
MNRNRLIARIAVAGAVFLQLSTPVFALEDNSLSPRFDPEKHWRSADLERGMRGYGLTVFQGTKIERFQVEILGILQNEWTETDMILAQVSGGPLRKTGVIAGMSGSPIYIDDKLVGALAYAWSFSKEAIAGITPIENMLPVLDLPATERGQEAGGAVTADAPGVLEGAQRTSTPLNWHTRFQNYLLKDHEGVLATPELPGTPVSGAQAWPAAGSFWENQQKANPLDSLGSPLDISVPGGWIPLGTPVTAGGVSSHLLEKAASFLSPLGLLPVPGGVPSAYREDKVELEGGSAIGVQLVGGDLSMAGIGTVSYRDGDSILAFGHPMFQDGATDLPMTTAYINTVISSMAISTKMGGALEIVGALEQDRLPAIAGKIGEKSNTLPMAVHVNNRSTGVKRDFSYDIAYHRFFTPRFAMFCVLDAIDVTARGFRDSTLSYTLTLDLKEGEDLVLKDQISSAGSTSFSVAMTLGDVVDLLMRNPFEKIDVEKIDLEIEMTDRLKVGTVEWVSVEGQEVEPGEEIDVSIAIQNWLGETEILRESVAIPEDFDGGYVQVTLADSRTYLTESLKRNPDKFRPRDAESLLKLLRTYYRNDELFITVDTLSPGASFFGNEMPGLPTSVLRVLAESGDQGTGTLTAFENIAEKKIDLDRPVSGSQRAVVNIEPSKWNNLN